MTSYQTYARANSGRAVTDSKCPNKILASYTEADNLEQALERCMRNFPEADGWTEHHVKNLETNEITHSANGFELDDLF